MNFPHILRSRVIRRAPSAVATVAFVLLASGPASPRSASPHRQPQPPTAVPIAGTAAPPVVALVPTVPAPPARALVVAVTGAPVNAQGVIRDVSGPAGDLRPVVALTFDDGPDPRWTPVVLQLLRDAGVRATFCLVGRAAAAHPDLVRAIRDAGHVVCDHTQDHVEHLDRRPRPLVEQQIAAGASTLTAILGAAPAFYRPPGGSLSPVVIAVAHQHGMAVLDWSDDPKDWRQPPPEAIVQTVLAELHPGAIVLLHDGGGVRSATLAALPEILRAIADRGYTFTTP